jgi:pimeloyl-ACP methyl ester carboxylesterase
VESIQVADCTLASLALGEGDPVVLVHGLVSGSMASWYFAVGQPLSATHRVLMYDQRGHGGSAVTAGGYDLESQAADLTRVLAHYGVDDSAPVDLVGHSMGALIALHFAQRFPHRVRRLILVDAPIPANRHVLPSLLAMSSKGAIEAHIDQQHQPKLLGRRRTRVFERLSALVFQTSLIADVSGMGTPDLAGLATVVMPTLLIYGRRSPCVDAATLLESALPDARLAVLDCGHYLLEEAPAEVFDAIRQFLHGDDANVNAFSSASPKPALNV